MEGKFQVQQNYISFTQTYLHYSLQGLRNINLVETESNVISKLIMKATTIIQPWICHEEKCSAGTIRKIYTSDCVSR